MSYAFHINRSRELDSPDVVVNGGLARDRITCFLDQVIWWGALGLIPLVAVPHGAEKLWWEAAFECYAFGLGALWIANGFLKGTWELRGGSLFIPLLLLAGYAFFQTIPFIPGNGILPTNGRQSLSADPAGTRAFLTELLALIILGKLLLDYAGNRMRLQLLVYLVIGVAASSAAFGLFRVIAQTAWPNLIVFGQAPGEGFGQFTNRNHFAVLLEMGFGLGLGYLIGGGVRRKHLVLHVGLVLLTGTTIVLTTSRGGVLALLTQVLLLSLAFVFFRAWPKQSHAMGGIRPWRSFGKVVLSVSLATGFVAVIAIGIVNLGGEPLTNRMEKLSGEVGKPEDDASGKRRDVWLATSRMIKAHPFTGSGLGAYFRAIPMYHDSSGRDTPSSSLNHYLDLMAGGGLIGVSLAAWFLFMLALRIRKQLKAQGSLRRAATLGALGGLFGLAAHSLVESGLQVPLNAVILLALLVISIADIESRTRPFTNSVNS